MLETIFIKLNVMFYCLLQTGKFKTDSAETSVPTYATTRRQIPQGRNLNIQRRNKLKSHRAKFPRNIISTNYLDNYYRTPR